MEADAARRKLADWFWRSCRPLWTLLVAAIVATGCGRVPSEPNAIVPLPPDPGTISNRSPAWSPRRAEIAFVHIARNLDEFSRGRYQIWLYDAVAETTSYLAAGFNPAWSPDGDSILFVGPNDRAFAIGRVTRAVTDLAAFGIIKNIAWSPTAPMLAITSDYGLLGGYHIFLVPLTGGPPKDISTVDYEGAWHAPDSTRPGIASCMNASCRTRSGPSSS